MSQSIVIRKPLRSEIPQLAELGSRLFRQTFAGLYPDADLKAFLDRVHSPAGVAYDWDQGCEFWIAEAAEGASWVGYCKAGPISVPAEVGGRRALECVRSMLNEPFIDVVSAQGSCSAFLICAMFAISNWLTSAVGQRMCRPWLSMLVTVLR